MIFCVYISAGWSNTRLSREADRHENQLNEWISEQTSILYMFTDTISAQPEIMDDYDTAVHWLNSLSEYLRVLYGKSVCRDSGHHEHRLDSRRG